MARSSTSSAATLAVSAAPCFCDLASIFAFSCANRESSLLSEHHWKELAHAYVAEVEDFWETAGCRPVAQSRPLGTWRAELRRLAIFRAHSERLLGTRPSIKDIMEMWVQA